MTLWLRVRRARTCAATSLAVVLALLHIGDIPLPLPNLLGGPVLAVRLALLLPLAVSIVVAWGLAAGDPVMEAVASRPLRVLDVAYALSAAMLMLTLCVCVWLLGSSNLALAAGRNTLGYVGMVLIARRLVGSDAAAVLPAGFAIISALFGIKVNTEPRLWAWLLATADKPFPWVVAVLLLAFGAVVALQRNVVASGER